MDSDVGLGTTLRAVPELLMDVAQQAQGVHGAARWLLPLLAQDHAAVGAVPPKWRAELLLLLSTRAAHDTSKVNTAGASRGRDVAESPRVVYLLCVSCFEE